MRLTEIQHLRLQLLDPTELLLLLFSLGSLFFKGKEPSKLFGTPRIFVEQLHHDQIIFLILSLFIVWVNLEVPFDLVEEGNLVSYLLIEFKFIP